MKDDPTHGALTMSTLFLAPQRKAIATTVTKIRTTLITQIYLFQNCYLKSITGTRTLFTFRATRNG